MKTNDISRVVVAQEVPVDAVDGAVIHQGQADLRLRDRFFNEHSMDNFLQPFMGHGENGLLIGNVDLNF